MLPYSGCLHVLITEIVCSVLTWSYSDGGPVERINLIFNTTTVPVTTTLKGLHGGYKGENSSRLRDISADEQWSR